MVNGEDVIDGMTKAAAVAKAEELAKGLLDHCTQYAEYGLLEAVLYGGVVANVAPFQIQGFGRGVIACKDLMLMKIKSIEVKRADAIPRPEDDRHGETHGEDGEVRDALSGGGPVPPQRH